MLLVPALLAALAAGAHEPTWTRYSRQLNRREVRLLARGVPLHALAAQPGADTETCRLRLRLVDAETREALSGLVRIAGPEGKALPLPGLVNRGIQLREGHPARDWHALLEAGTVDVPRARLVLDAVAGPGSERTTLPLELDGRAAASVEIAVRRFAHPERQGWRSGNTHLHLSGLTRPQADEYLRTLPRADGLELLFVSYLERAVADRDYISNRYTAADLRALTGPGLLFGNGEEHRHNFTGYPEGYGHVMLLNLRRLVQPVSIGADIMKKGSDWPPLSRGIRQARRQGATIVWCHNDYGMEDTPHWLAGRIHAHNIFDGGHHGSYADTFYRYLNLGLKVPFSTGTDWFLYDISRAYVRVEGELTVQRWLAALTQGRSYITNGPLLELRAGGHAIGETLRLTGPRTVPIQGAARGRHDFRALELVHNGEVIARAPSRAVGRHFESDLRFDLPVNGPGWVALKIAGNGPGPANRPSDAPRNDFGEALFGHTSPIYLEMHGRRLVQPEVARAFIRDLETSLRAIRTHGKFDTEAQREEVLSLYRRAMDTLRRKIEGSHR